MNSRLRLLAIERLFINKKQLTMKEIKTELKNVYGIESERKAIYKDIEALKNFFFIKKKKVNNTTIYVLEKVNKETKIFDRKSLKNDLSKIFTITIK